MAEFETYERPGIAGSGTIATGLAACASTASQVRDPQNPELVLTVRRVGYRFAEGAT
jgi:hypothetical protein